MRLKRLVIAAFAAAGLQLAEAQAAELRIGFTLDPLTLDPANHRSRETESVLRTMYNGLVAHDPTMKLVPEVIEGWIWIDPRTMDVKVRQGVTFHSGEPMTADDVV